MAEDKPRNVTINDFHLVAHSHLPGHPLIRRGEVLFTESTDISPYLQAIEDRVTRVREAYRMAFGGEHLERVGQQGGDYLLLVCHPSHADDQPFYELHVSVAHGFGENSQGKIDLTEICTKADFLEGVDK
ncbi:MAG: hypothetical protein H6502_04195 [Candidatus Woesearchaeota archaeon]|nr:MAG: hypothetical protein H6502_04195 [Candidatus Woesearchaeota archaeon]